MGLTNPPYYQRNCILKTSMATVYGNRNDQEQSHIKKSRITGSKKPVILFHQDQWQYQMQKNVFCTGVFTALQNTFQIFI